MKFKKRSLCNAEEEVSQLHEKIFALNQKIQNIQHAVDKQLQHSSRGRKFTWGTLKKMSELKLSLTFLYVF